MELIAWTSDHAQVFGKGGAYVCILEEQRSMNGVAFENMAKSGQRSPPTRKYAEDDLMERSFWSSITVRHCFAVCINTFENIDIG